MNVLSGHPLEALLKYRMQKSLRSAVEQHDRDVRSLGVSARGEGSIRGGL